MEAKDTIIKCETSLTCCLDCHEAQAEISFKLRTDDILKQLNEFNEHGVTLTEAIALLK